MNFISPEVAKKLLTTALEIEPTLKPSGFKKGAETFTEKHLAQVASCAEFIALYCSSDKMSPAINKRRTSYGLKHDVENWTARFAGKRQYIHEGTFIAAAIGMGIAYEIDSSGHCCLALDPKKMKGAGGYKYIGVMEDHELLSVLRGDGVPCQHKNKWVTLMRKSVVKCLACTDCGAPMKVPQDTK